MVTATTFAGTWVLPAHRALWLPANTPVTLEVVCPTALRMLYLRRRRHSGAFDPHRCAVLTVTPLLRELILRSVQIGVLEKQTISHRRLAGLIHDELREIESVPLQLPKPRNPMAIEFIRHLEDTKNIPSSISQIGISRRSLERNFVLETGMSLGQWVRQWRLLAALRLLGEGQSVSEVAFILEFSSPSSFIAMFRRELGTTPGAFFQASN